jgi:hypothetical protein
MRSLMNGPDNMAIINLLGCVCDKRQRSFFAAGDDRNE